MALEVNLVIKSTAICSTNKTARALKEALALILMLTMLSQLSTKSLLQCFPTQTKWSQEGPRKASQRSEGATSTEQGAGWEQEWDSSVPSLTILTSTQFLSTEEDQEYLEG